MVDEGKTCFCFEYFQMVLILFLLYLKSIAASRHHDYRHTVWGDKVYGLVLQKCKLLCCKTRYKAIVEDIFVCFWFPSLTIISQYEEMSLPSVNQVKDRGLKALGW